jgi:hypothetical protein
MGVRRNTHKCFRKPKENRPLAVSRSSHKITLICILKLKAGGRGKFYRTSSTVEIFQSEHK